LMSTRKKPNSFLKNKKKYYQRSLKDYSCSLTEK
jgi:hypothetical protein